MEQNIHRNASVFLLLRNIRFMQIHRQSCIERLLHRDFLLYSVVEFASYRDMRVALKKLDGSTLYGKRIRCIDVSCYNLDSFSVTIIEKFGLGTLHSKIVQ